MRGKRRSVIRGNRKFSLYADGLHFVGSKAVDEGCDGVNVLVNGVERFRNAHAGDKNFTWSRSVRDYPEFFHESHITLDP